MIKFISALIMSLLLTSNAYAGCKTKRHVFFENAHTKVWRATICPEQHLPFHRHKWARIVSPLQSGKLKVFYKDGHKYTLRLKKNKPVYLSVEQGRKMHQDINAGKKPLQVIVTELKNS